MSDDARRVVRIWLFAIGYILLLHAISSCTHRVGTVSRGDPEAMLQRSSWCAITEYGPNAVPIVSCTPSKDLCLYAVHRVRQQGGLLRLVAAGDCVWVRR